MDRAIVVVEDELPLRHSAIETFASAGLDVVDFEDGDRTLAYVRANPEGGATVFTDVRLMGAMDGLRIARAITEAHPAITVVVTSGGFAERPAELGARLVDIGKPWMAMDVLDAIIDAKQDDRYASRSTRPGEDHQPARRMGEADIPIPRGSSGCRVISAALDDDRWQARPRAAARAA